MKVATYHLLLIFRTAYLIVIARPTKTAAQPGNLSCAARCRFSSAVLEPIHVRRLKPSVRLGHPPFRITAPPVLALLRAVLPCARTRSAATKSSKSQTKCFSTPQNRMASLVQSQTRQIRLGNIRRERRKKMQRIVEVSCLLYHVLYCFGQLLYTYSIIFHLSSSLRSSEWA